MDDELPKLAGLHRDKDRKWTLRRRVPDEIRPIIGRREIWKSYGDLSTTEVRRRHSLEMAKVDAIFAEARQRLVAGEVQMQPQVVSEPLQLGPIRSQSFKPPPALTRPLPEPTEDVVRDAVLRWFHGEERKAEEGDREAQSPESSVTPEEAIDLRRTDEAHLSGLDGEQIAERELNGLLRGYGFGAPRGQLRHLAIDLLQAALVEVAQRSRRRLGDPEVQAESHSIFAGVHALGAPPPAPAPALAAAQPLPAADLLKLWHAGKSTRADATLTKYTRAFAHVARILGFRDVQKLDVRRITADDVFKFTQARQVEKTKAGKQVDPKTVRDEVLACGAVCTWAVKTRRLKENPFAGMAPDADRRGPAPKIAYTDEEAKLILTAARGKTGWLRWAPWLMAFTGARVSEFADMHRGHVRKVGETWIFDMDPTAQRKLKTGDSQRMIPIHPAVVAEGFLAYVDALPEDPAGPLFPDITPNEKGKRAVNATSGMGRWIRGKIGITDTRKAPDHSWRHRIQDELRKVRAPDEVVDAITGRSNPRNAGAGYGKGFRRMPEETLKELRQIPSPVPPFNPG
jgi:integrase